MPRRRKHRRIVAPPGFRGYTPYGTNAGDKTPIELLYEEYEAIKLADYDMLNHLAASEMMGVSRATFARIYETARQKISKALVESRGIKSVFGNAVMEERWHICNDCNTRFTIPNTVKLKNCALCNSTNIQSITNNK